MRAVSKFILMLFLIPLVIPFGFIAIMLDPFIEIILEEKKDDNSK